MVTVMEVGKKYTHNEFNSTIYECIKILDDGNAVLIWRTSPNGTYSAGVASKTQFQHYTEYEEPRKGTVWVNIYPDGTSSVWQLEKCANARTHRRIACIEVPWVEGQGLTKS